MKASSHNKSGRNLAILTQSVALLLLTTNSAHAVSATWTGASDNLWQTATNWDAGAFSGTTGSITSYANTDTATFSTSGSGAISLNGSLNIKNILFSTGAGSFTVGGATDALYLTGAGSITVNGGVTTDETIGTAGGTINLSSSNNSTYSFLNNGTGTLTIADTVTANQIATRTTTLTLGGAGNGVISGALTYAAGSGAGAAGLAITKIGSGSWTLSGANTYSGLTTINGGTLIYDFSTGNTPVSAINNLTLSNGVVTFKGKASGVTTVTTGTLNLGGAYDVVNKVTLDANGGSGVALTATALSFSVGTGALSILLDLSSSASNSITVSALGTGYSVQNGVLMAGNTGNYRANTIVHDSTGYGWATLSGATSGSIGRLTSSSAAATTLTASSSSATANYFLTTAGTLTRTANLDFSTMTIDSSAGAVTLDMATYNFANSGQGRGILVTGNNDVTLAGSGSFSSTGLVYNYGTGKLTINQSTANTTAFVLGGTGFIDYAGTIGTGVTTGFAIETLVRISKAQNIASGSGVNSKFRVSNGVMEIGADLNGSTSGDFTNSIGTSTGQIVFRGDSGLSASGAYRTVNFGGASAGITWGASGFLCNADDSTDGNYTFKLSSAQSDATLEIQNGIALGGSTSRVIEVANGSAAIDAVLSGVLSGDGATLTKTGLGTLSLTAANTYSGPTFVNAGELSVNSSLASSAVTVASGATLSGSGTVNGATTVNGGTINGRSLNLGATTLHGTSTLSGYNLASNVTVASGTTSLSGTTKSTSTLSVAAGATLNANGTIDGSASISGLMKGTSTVTGNLTLTSGTLAPGNSPGITTVEGNFTTDAFSTLVAEVSGTVAGTSYDQVKVSGNVSLAGILDLSTLSGLTMGSKIILIDNTGSGTTAGYFSTIITTGSTYTATSNADYTFTVAGTEYLLSYSSNTGGDGYANDVTLTVVPEPGTWAMLVGGIGMLAFGQRMRRRGDR
ncbi:MAG: beta strand repeat-containing protein [Chthoniobacteraceae bacterium]